MRQRETERREHEQRREAKEEGEADSPLRRKPDVNAGLRPEPKS